MKCKYYLEDIISFFENTISKEKKEELFSHIKECKKCSTAYKSLALTKKYAATKVDMEKNFVGIIENSIDKSKYRSRNKFTYQFKGFVYNRRHILGYSGLSLVIIMIFVISISHMEIFNSFRMGKTPIAIDIKNTPEVKFTPVPLTTMGAESHVIETEPSSTIRTEPSPDENSMENIIIDGVTYVYKSEIIKSPDGKITARVAYIAGEPLEVVILNDDIGVHIIELTNIIFNGIYNFEWIGDKYIGLHVHLNPSQSGYIVIDPYQRKVVDVFYGLGFTWNNTISKLYYISTSPHFSATEDTDKVVDNHGNIYYESDAEASILDEMAVSEDEKTFAFYVDQNETRKLFLGRLGEDSKIYKLAELENDYGKLVFENNNTIAIMNHKGLTALERVDISQYVKN